jgi:hypothetical protein
MDAPSDIAGLLRELEETQVEAVALAAASASDGVLGVYDRGQGWTAVVTTGNDGEVVVVVDGQPDRRSALEALVVEHEARAPHS